MDEECPTDTGTTRVIRRVMGKLSAILRVLHSTPVTHLSKEQRELIARDLKGAALMMRGVAIDTNPSANTPPAAGPGTGGGDNEP